MTWWRPAWSPAGAVTLASLVALALAMHRLGEYSLRLDEAVSVAIAQSPPELFWQVTTTSHGNMALYHVLLRPWMSFGDAEAMVRSLSVVWAVASVPVAYLAGRRLIGTHAGVLAAALVAVHAFLLRYAQEARAYSLLVFVATLSTYLLAEAVARRDRRWWLAYGFVSGASMYVHFFAVLTLVAQLSSLAWKRRELRWPDVAAAVLVAGFVSLPVAVYIAMNAEGVPISWIPTPTTETLADAVLQLTGNGTALLQLLLAGFAVAGVVIGVVTGRTWPVALLVLCFALPIAVSFAYSVVVMPVFRAYYLIGTVPPLLLLAAWGLSAVRPRPLGVSAAAVVVGLSLLAVWDSYQERREDWRAATTAVVHEALPGDGVVILAAFSRVPFEYYVRHTGAPAAEPLFPNQPWGTFRYGDRRGGTLEAAVERLAVGDRVWLVLRSPPMELPEILSMMGGQAVSARDFTGGIRVVEVEIVRQPGSG